MKIKLSILISFLLLMRVNSFAASSRSPLLQALWESNLSEAYRLIDSGVNLDEKDSYGRTALMFSINELETKMAKYLIQKGANVHLKDNLGWSALHHAIDESEHEVIRMLMEKNVNIEERDNQGDTPIHIAARGYDDFYLKVLASYGANVNARNNFGESILMISHQLEDWSSVEVGLHLGALPFSFREGVFAFDIPMDELYQKAFFTYKDFELNNHLLRFIKSRQWEVVRELIKADFTLEEQNLKGENALILLTKSNQIDLVRILVKEKNVFLNSRDRHDKTALFYANRLEDKTIYQLILETGGIE